MLKIRAQIFLLIPLLFWQSLSVQNADNKLFAGPPDNVIQKSYSLCAHDDFTTIDEWAFTVSPEGFSSIEAFTLHLTNKYPDEKSKARILYTWIALNIDYDYETIPGSDRNDQKAASVWREKQAVCEGYANLFTAMCRIAGLESRVIIGYVRERDGQPLQNPNHAWNSVMIDGKWRLIDVTWASLRWQQERRGNTKITEIIDPFFLTDPSEMIYTHLPEDPYWQLQGHHVSLEQFESGEKIIWDVLNGSKAQIEDFEQLIAGYENLDSLDRSIALLERQEENKWNKAREYNLGIAYFYKAQMILQKARSLPTGEKEQAKMLAREYYERSLDQLSLIDERDKGYEFSKALSNNVTFRIETLR